MGSLRKRCERANVESGLRNYYREEIVSSYTLSIPLHADISYRLRRKELSFFQASREQNVEPTDLPRQT